jgi:hypothetical protein
MGGGGLAATAQQNRGVGRDVGMTSSNILEDDGLPGYSPMVTDEGVDMDEGDGEEMPPIYGPPNLAQDWSFSNLGSIGAPHSQMTVVPPSSLDGEGEVEGGVGGEGGFFTQEEDLFAQEEGADDNASMRAEGGTRSSVGELSEREEEFVDAPGLGEQGVRMRESAPPPGGEDDGS